MVNTIARLIVLGAIWLAAVWIGCIALFKPRRALDFIQDQLPTLDLWNGIFLKEESQKLWFIRFQGAIFLALMLALGADFAARYYRNGASLTLSSTRTPPALSPALSLVPSSSASLSASAQAGPVSSVR
jgi:hypothetical protein